MVGSEHANIEAEEFDEDQDACAINQKFGENKGANEAVGPEHSNIEA